MAKKITVNGGEVPVLLFVCILTGVLTVIAAFVCMSASIAASAPAGRGGGILALGVSLFYAGLFTVYIGVFVNEKIKKEEADIYGRISDPEFSRADTVLMFFFLFLALSGLPLIFIGMYFKWFSSDADGFLPALPGLVLFLLGINLIVVKSVLKARKSVELAQSADAITARGTVTNVGLHMLINSTPYYKITIFLEDGNTSYCVLKDFAYRAGSVITVTYRPKIPAICLILDTKENAEHKYIPALDGNVII